MCKDHLARLWPMLLSCAAHTSTDSQTDWLQVSLLQQVLPIGPSSKTSLCSHKRSITSSQTGWLQITFLYQVAHVDLQPEDLAPGTNRLVANQIQTRKRLYKKNASSRPGFRFLGLPITFLHQVAHAGLQPEDLAPGRTGWMQIQFKHIKG